MSLTRRQLLQTSAAALGASKLLAGVDSFFRPASPLGANTQQLITACGICSPSCGIKATIEDGTVRFLQGLPGDFSGDGFLCAKGASGLSLLYDPDRLKYPMRRSNPRKGLHEDPGWVRISWQEALDEIASRFNSYRQQFGAESLLFLSRATNEMMARLFRAIGAVNVVNHIDICYTADTVIMRWTVGGKTWIADVEESKYIISFGWDMVARSKIVNARGVVKAKERGAKLVVFNPEYNATAKLADEWYPIRPGTDLAVALALINVILSQNLFDREFVDNYTNFRDYEPQIRAHFSRFSPEWAEQQSDVPAEAIRRIATEFASTRPAIAPVHKKTPIANYMNSTQTAFALSILNILAGNIDRRGGRYFARTVSIPSDTTIFPPPTDFPPATGRRVDGRDRLPLAHPFNQGMFATLADGILNKYPGMIKGALLEAYGALAFPQPLQFLEALSTIDFVVVYDVLPNDTVNYADIVLPGATYLESSGLVARNFRAPYPQVTVRQPLVPAMYETRSTGFLGAELGRRMAPDYFRTPDGQWITQTALLEQQVKQAGIASSMAEFRSKGVFERPAPFTPRTTFNVPGNKCQIYVPQFEKDGEPLPEWRPKAELPSPEYPYYYLTYIPPMHRRSSTQNSTVLHEMMPTNTANMNPQLAQKLGIHEGQRVRIRSRVGAIELPAHLTETLRPDCVMVAHGFGHVSHAMRLAGGHGARDGDVIPSRSIEELIAAKNFGGSGCIMDAVVAIDPL
jgi:thiosulfate reductase/polysulfide reductase chain A